MSTTRASAPVCPKPERPLMATLLGDVPRAIRPGGKTHVLFCQGRTYGVCLVWRGETSLRHASSEKRNSGPQTPPSTSRLSVNHRAALGISTHPGLPCAALPCPRVCRLSPAMVGSSAGDDGAGANAGRAPWRERGLAGRPRTPCEPLPYVPAQQPSHSPWVPEPRSRPGAPGRPLEASLKKRSPQ